jgi:hypothetical protein
LNDYLIKNWLIFEVITSTVVKVSIYTWVDKTPSVYIVVFIVWIFVHYFDRILVQVYFFINHEWRFLLLVVDVIPVNALEEWVFTYLFSVALAAQPFGRVALKQLFEYVNSLRTEWLVLLQLVVFDFVEHLVPVLVEVGRDAVQHFVEQDSEQVPVDTFAVARLVEHLGRQVGDAAAETGGLRVVVDLLLAQPEVGQLGVALPVEHHVVRLEVSLNDVLRVQVFDRQQDLRRLELGSIFVKFLQFVQDLS